MRKNTDQRTNNREESEFTERLINLNRVAKVLKGGRRMRFSALMVVGNRKGQAGFALGKANDVAEAIRKASHRAKQNMRQLPMKRKTLPYSVVGRFKSTSVRLMPATPGTGVIAGGAVRAIMEACGIQDVLAKIYGSRKKLTVVRAVFNGFDQILDGKEVSKARERTLEELWN